MTTDYRTRLHVEHEAVEVDVFDFHACDRQRGIHSDPLSIETSFPDEDLFKFLEGLALGLRDKFNGKDECK